jgi:sugar/nucleoside kinase (ribokinase family)
MKRLVGFGLVNKDLVAVAPGIRLDHKAEARHYFEQVGGPVPVALQCAARLDGVECTALGVVGADLEGAQVSEWLESFGVEARLQRTPGVATSKSLVLLDETDGARTLANYAEELPPFTFDPETEKLLRSADLLHIDGRDLSGCLRAATLTRAGGGKVSYDLGTMRTGREALFPMCDLILASKKGGAGAFPDLANDPLGQVQGFLDAGATIAGVTLAEQGVALGWRGGPPPTLLPAFAVERVVDTCGAGDTFHGAFVWAHLAGYPPPDAARFAMAAVALRIQRFGNNDGLPYRETVSALSSAAPR